MEGGPLQDGSEVDRQWTVASRGSNTRHRIEVLTEAVASFNPLVSPWVFFGRKKGAEAPDLFSSQ
jgi:hypothetical protein